MSKNTIYCDIDDEKLSEMRSLFDSNGDINSNKMIEWMLDSKNGMTYDEDVKKSLRKIVRKNKLKNIDSKN